MVVKRYSTPNGHLSPSEYFSQKIAIFQKTKSVKSLDLESLEELFRHGHSVIIKNLHNRISCLRKMRAALQSVFDCHVDFQFFFTPSHLAAFPIHCDDHDVLSFTFQGTKHWSLFDRKASKESKIDFEIQPGEAIYIPRGHFHQTLTLDQPSVHLSIGIYGHSYGSRLKEIVEKVVMENSDYQESLFDDRPPDYLIKNLQESITQEWRGSKRSNLKQRVTSTNLLAVFDSTAVYKVVEGLSLHIDSPSTLVAESEAMTKHFKLLPEQIEELLPLVRTGRVNPVHLSRGTTAFLIDFYRLGIVTQSE
jgi:hypothetical protein